MSRKPSFAASLAGVVAGVLFLVMSAAFVLVPYSLAGHPGEAPVHLADAGTYHPT